MPKPAPSSALSRCVVCGKSFTPLRHIGRRAKVCTEPGHVCKKKITERADGGRRVLPCVDACCRSKYHAGAAAQFLAGHLDRAKWFENPDDLVKALRKVDRLDEPYRMAIFFIVETGARVGEAVLLRRGDVAVDSKIPHVMLPTLKRKGRPRRRIDLSREFAADLEVYLKATKKAGPDDPVFPCGKRTLQFWWRRAQEDAKLPIVRGIHSLRHTHFSRLAEAGVEPRVAQERAGWSSLSMYSIYTHVSDRQRESLITLLPNNKLRR